MKRSSVTSGAVAVLVGISLTACGGDAPGEGGGPTTQAAAPAAGAAGANIPASMQAFSDDGDVAEIVIEANDLIRYNLDRFSVRPGQMVRITLNHVGSLPAQAMGHNVVVLNSGEDVFEFGADVGMNGGSAANDFVPEALRDRVVAFTAMIGGGETATVEFQAPEAAGEHPFLCSFPGHFAQMNGVMVVE